MPGILSVFKMHASYHLVFINLFVSLVLGILVCVTKFILHKKINYLLLLILISILPVLSIFRSGTYESGLLTENVQLAISFYDTLRDGNLFPVWAHTAFAGYGNPAHLFMYPLPFYLTSIIHSLGVSFLDSVKSILALSFVFSGITMFYWIKNKLGEIPAFVASLFYLFAPYHLIELHFRVAIGVTLGFVFIPLSFLFFDKLINTNKFKYIFPGGFALGLLMLSHPALFTVTFLFLIPYVLFLLRNKMKNFKILFKSIVFFLYGLAISAFYWIPLITESNLIKHVSSLHTGDFKHFWEYIYSPTFYGFLFQGHYGETHFIIGYPHLLIVIFAVILLFRKKFKGESKSLMLFLIFEFIFLFFMLQEISRPFWQLPILKDVPDAWRILAPIALLTSLLAGYITKYILGLKPKNSLIIGVVCFVAVFSTILNWGNRKTVPLNYNAIKASFMALPEPNDNRTWTIWVPNNALWKQTIPTADLQVVRGNANIKEIFRNSTKHEYVISVSNKSIIKENTLYFPGWNVKVDGKNYPFTKTYKPYGGLIVFDLKKGIYKVDVVLENSKIRDVSQKISTFSFTVMVMFFSIVLMLKVKRKYA